MAARSDPIGRGTDTHRYGGVPGGGDPLCLSFLPIFRLTCALCRLYPCISPLKAPSYILNSGGSGLGGLEVETVEVWMDEGHGMGGGV